jgi:hypothetical protein
MTIFGCARITFIVLNVSFLLLFNLCNFFDLKIVSDSKSNLHFSSEKRLTNSSFNTHTSLSEKSRRINESYVKNSAPSKTTTMTTTRTQTMITIMTTTKATTTTKTTTKTTKTMTTTTSMPTTTTMTQTITASKISEVVRPEKLYVIVPFRDREENKEVFVDEMKIFLDKKVTANKLNLLKKTKKTEKQKR